MKVWGCMLWRGVSPLHLINSVMDQHVYKNIMEDIMLPCADEHLPVIWEYVQDNNPEHTAKMVKMWFADNEVDVIEWSSNNPDLNLIEHLWNDVKHD
ncbi:hypothetical protein Trydic_g9545 [Trypoxylus dichotomus]